MPYKLRKCPGKDLYWVVNKETGQKHSKEGLPKEQAKAQMRALYANEKKGGMSGGAVLASHPAVDTLYDKANTFTASLEADNSRQLANEAVRAKNKGAMEEVLSANNVGNAIGGKRSHKAQHIRYMLGKLKERQKGYNKPFNPFNPKLVSTGNRSAFLNRMMKEKSVVPKRDMSKVKVEEEVEEKVVEKKTRGRKPKKTIELSETIETPEVSEPTPVSEAKKDKFARAKELRDSGLKPNKIADQLKAEGYSKVSPSWVRLALKGSGYDEHPEDFFF
jgi:hypothetical protein